MVRVQDHARMNHTVTFAARGRVFFLAFYFAGRAPHIETRCTCECMPWLLTASGFIPVCESVCAS